MKTNMFRDRLNNNIQHCIAEAESASQIEHAGLTGTLRELMVQKLLSPLLPEGYYIGTGKITDTEGNMSSQTDIIIYNKRSIPPILFDEKTGIFPIEIVHYVIEVKSKATNTEIQDSIKKGKNLRTLSGAQPISAFFSFDTDLTNMPEKERFIQPQKDIKVPLPINIFCVAPRTYGYWDKVWNVYESDNKIDIIRAFLVGTLNTLATLVKEPPRIEPGWYFYPDVEKP